MRNFNTLEFNEYPELKVTDLNTFDILSLENALNVPNGEVLDIKTIDYECKGFMHEWTVNIMFASGGSKNAILTKVEYYNHFEVVEV